MSTKTAICNLALQAMGARPSLNDVDADATKVASELKAAYDNARDAVIRSHEWKFATALGTWAAMATAPAFGFGKKYALAADPHCLRVLRLHPDYHGGAPLWRVVGRELHTDEGAPLYVEFLFRVTDTALMDPMFVEALALKLALATAANIIGEKANKQAELARRHAEAIRDARWAGAIEGRRRDPPAGDFLSARAGA